MKCRSCGQEMNPTTDFGVGDTVMCIDDSCHLNQPKHRLELNRFYVVNEFPTDGEVRVHGSPQFWRSDRFRLHKVCSELMFNG